MLTIRPYEYHAVIQYRMLQIPGEGNRQMWHLKAKIVPIFGWHFGPDKGRDSITNQENICCTEFSGNPSNSDIKWANKYSPYPII